MKAWLEGVLQRCWWQRSASPLARVLWPLSLLYRGLLWLHQRRAVPTVMLPVPVLVVGNYVVGGAGKTPTVIALVQALQARGYHPGVVSRGHGRRGTAPRAVQGHDNVQDVGDEPLLIQRRCKVPVWVGRQRVAAAFALCQAHPEVDVLVSDDGLQHRELPRQAELVVFDERGSGNGLLLPAGPLRELLPAQPQPAHRVLYTAGQASTPLPGWCATRRLSRAWPLAAWHDGDAAQAVALPHLSGRSLLAAAGMAAPEKFFNALGDAGLQFTRLPLPDHHPYTTLPWPPGTPDVLVTEKDAVKLAAAAQGGTRVWVLPLDFELPSGLVEALVNQLFPPPPPVPSLAKPPQPKAAP